MTKPIKIRLNIEAQFDNPSHAGMFVVELIQVFVSDDQEAVELLRPLANAIQEQLTNPHDEPESDGETDPSPA